MNKHFAAPPLSMLKMLAQRYVPTDAEARNLAEQAFRILCDEPDCLGEGDIEKAFFLIMHQLAQEALVAESSADS